MNLYLTGLTANNPLGYLAALGVLALLDRNKAGHFRWAHQGGCWVPEVEGFANQDALTAFLLPLLQNDPTAALQNLPPSKIGLPPGAIIPPEDYAKVGQELLERGDRRGLDLLAALATDCVLVLQDKKLRADRSRLHMASGTKSCYLLKIVQQASAKITAARLTAALYQSWDRSDPSSRSGWDHADLRDLARVEEPTKEKTSETKKLKSKKATEPKEASATTSMWGAILLAWESLALFPVFPFRKRSSQTTGFTSQNGGCLFCRPVWTDCLTVDGVRTVLALQEVYGDGDGLKERGIPEVLRSRQISMGKSFRFKPARAVRAAG